MNINIEYKHCLDENGDFVFGTQIIFLKLDNHIDPENWKNDLCCVAIKEAIVETIPGAEYIFEQDKVFIHYDKLNKSKIQFLEQQIEKRLKIIA